MLFDFIRFVICHSNDTRERGDLRRQISLRLKESIWHLKGTRKGCATARSHGDGAGVVAAGAQGHELLRLHR